MLKNKKTIASTEYVKSLLNAAIENIDKKLNSKKANWNQNDKTAIDYIKNRTHYTEIGEISTNILEWDGNFDGLVGSTIAPEWNSYKVSDIILDSSDLNGATVTFSDGYQYVISNNTWFNETDSVIDFENFIIAKKDNAEYQEIILPEAGIYFPTNPDDYLSKLELANGSKIEWDGNFNNLVGLTTAKWNRYKVSDVILDSSDLNGATVTVSNGYQYVLDEDFWFEETDSVIYFENFIIAKKDNAQFYSSIFPEAGIYFVIKSDGYISKLELTSEITPFRTISEIVHKIDKKYLPEISSIKNILDGNAKSSVRTVSTNIEIGDYAFAEGYSTTASGWAAHAEGHSTTASSDYSHAEGVGTTASGKSSHAEGDDTIASGKFSHAEGEGTTASGQSSHAEGAYTTASNYYSHAEGMDTIAAGEYQHVQGKFNIDDSNNKYAHIVGNGKYGQGFRSNAHTLDWDGNAWFAGDVYVGSTSGKNKDAGSKKLVTIEDLSNASTIGLEDAKKYTDEKVAAINTALNGKETAGAAAQALTDAKAYTDQELANLVGTAPETLDTIEELATAFQENEDIIETLNQAISNKADKTDLEAFATKEYVDTEVNKPKNYVMFVDQVNGYNYAVQMRNGNLVSRCTISTIEVTTLPNKVEYLQGEYLDTTGMVITATCYDGNTFEITDYTYANEPLVVGENAIEISYTEYGMTYTTSFKVVTEGFNPEVTLIDFDYTTNDDGTYTLTEWKQTLNGEPSTKMVIPDYSVIRL